MPNSCPYYNWLLVEDDDDDAFLFRRACTSAFDPPRQISIMREMEPQQWHSLVALLFCPLSLFRT